MQKTKEPFVMVGDIIGDLDDVATLIGNHTHCVRMKRGQMSCITIQTEGAATAWHDFEWKKFCPSCSAYWSTLQAINDLQDYNKRS